MRSKNRAASTGLEGIDVATLAGPDGDRHVLALELPQLSKRHVQKRD